MVASLTYPVYGVKIVDSKGNTYNVIKACTSLTVAHPAKELAQKVKITVKNVRVDGKRLHELISVKDKVYVTYNIGNGAVEMFRGVVWTKESVHEDSKEFGILAYDNLIYLQNSKDNFYFAKNKTTKTVLANIAKKWGLTISNSYTSIKHGSLVFRSQYISDTIIEILEEVKRKKNKKYQLYSDKGTVYVKNAGTNTTIYKIKQKENATSSKISETMDGMITQIIITGDKGKGQIDKKLATVKGDTKKYGTLQDILHKGNDTKLSDSKSEAKEILKEKGKPFKTRTVEAIDNPAIRKGDMVYISTNNLSGNYIVTDIDHDCIRRTMTVEVDA